MIEVVITLLLALLICIILIEIINWFTEMVMINHYPITFKTFKYIYNTRTELYLGGICVNGVNYLQWNYFYFTPWEHFFLYLPFYIRKRRENKRQEAEEILSAIKHLKEETDSQK